MRKSYSLCLLVLLFITNIFSGIAQTEGISSGSIYTLKSKANNKLLSVSNSSMDYGANVNCWTNTNSDSERWIATLVYDSTYKLVNVASGEYLHMASNPTNSVNVNQYPYTSNISWVISPAGDGSYMIKAASNKNYALNVENGGLTDGTNVNIFRTENIDNQKWIFQQEEAKELAPSAVAADEIFNAWKTNYYDTRTGNEVIKGEGFWGVAEMMEIVDDAYEVTGNTKYKTMFGQMYNLFLSKEGSDWMWNEYNDDIAWMVIACTRAGLLTGMQSYIYKAQDQFDKMYARAATNLYGGGLIWKQGTQTKNACINGPAMVACCYLAQATGDESYYEKAITIYNWSKIYLLNAATGKVNDAYDGSIHDWSSTYNQGTYLGAAMMLYNYTKDPAYLADAINIAKYTKSNMYSNKVINNEEGPDLNGFKGIFMRYARRFTVDGNKTDLISWLKLNATVAYNNRNSKNLISTLWGTKTSETDALSAFSASTAVSLLVNCPDANLLVKNAYDTIEAENFDYIKGISVEECTEGTLNITGIVNNYYTAYNNVDFGENGADSAKFRVSAISTGGRIEIHLGSVTGTIIGTAEIPNTESWTNYTSISCKIELTKGLQNIYLVYKGGGTICKFNNFSFVESVSSGFGKISDDYKNIVVYPNPVKNQLNFESKDLNIKSVSIIDISGRQIFSSELTNFHGTKSIDVSSLACGIYLLNMMTDKDIKIVRKFTK